MTSPDLVERRDPLRPEPVILHPPDGPAVVLGHVQNERFTGNENFRAWLDTLLTPETRALLAKWERTSAVNRARHARKRAALSFLALTSETKRSEKETV